MESLAQCNKNDPMRQQLLNGADVQLQGRNHFNMLICTNDKLIWLN